MSAPTAGPALATLIVPPGGHREPIARGLALPRGALFGPAHLRRMGASGAPVLADLRPLLRWSDGSVRWLLAECMADAEEMALTLHAGPSPEDAPRLDAPVLALPDRCALTLQTPVRRSRAPRFEPDTRDALDEGVFRSSRLARGRLGRLRIEVRNTRYAGCDLTRLEIVVHNPRAARHAGGLWDLGDPGSLSIRDLSLFIEAEGDAELEVDPLSDHEPLEPGLHLHQASSGGERWDSPTHIDATGKVRLPFRGYRLGLRRGLRAEPILRKGELQVAVHEFWQNFPKTIGIPDNGRGVRVGLLPSEQGALHELQGGERRRHTIWLGSGFDLGFVHRPRRVFQAPHQVTASGALPELGLPTDDPPGAADRLARVVDPVTGLAARREVVDEYGWRNFGDLYADHEAVNHRSMRPFVSHYNNQYDGLEAFLLCFLRTGDARWYDLACPLARHVMDIDLYHTTQDRAAYALGQFWHTDHYVPAATATHRCYSRENAGQRGRAYGGGPSNEQNYPSGLWLYHLLTGDPWARQAGRQLADWVVAMDDGRRTLLGLVDGGPTGLASQTATPDYHGPGRGVGNSINALCEAALHDGDDRLLAMAESLIARVADARQDLVALALLDAERRWSYVVFLKYLLKYLRMKEERGALDAAYRHGRAALLHYARYMVAHERPSTTEPDRLEHVTETWPAQDLRKAQVLAGAAAYADGAERAAFLACADRTWAEALAELRTYETADLCRPLILAIHPALALSAAHGAHPHRPPALVGPGPAEPTPTEPGPPDFVPQKSRVRAALRSPRGLLATLRHAVARSRLWRDRPQS